MELSTSPNRDSRTKQVIENLKKESDDDSVDYLSAFFDYSHEETEEWKKNNLEYDLRSTEWILEKVSKSESYAQNLYAAMCNNRFQRIETWSILSDEYWSCSWRSAGGIVANMKQTGDYMDYYCSGIRGDFESVPEDQLTEEQKQYRIEVEKYVPESVVTDEIRTDIRKLGWVIVPYDEKDI